MLACWAGDGLLPHDDLAPTVRGGSSTTCTSASPAGPPRPRSTSSRPGTDLVARVVSSSRIGQPPSEWCNNSAPSAGQSALTPRIRAARRPRPGSNTRRPRRSTRRPGVRCWCVEPR
jgi:hypothetical protein